MNYRNENTGINKLAIVLLTGLLLAGFSGVVYPFAGNQLFLVLLAVMVVIALALFFEKQGTFFLGSLLLFFPGLLFYPQLDWRWPFHGMFVLATLLVSLILLSTGIFQKQAWTGRLNSLSWLPGIFMMVFSTVFFLGLLEWSALGLTEAGVLEKYSAMKTQLRPGTDDWRDAHITADWYREPDPVLLWRSKSGVGPYNKQRFKGPDASIPKKDGVFRIMTYGDSNTDGPDVGAWPQRLQEVLERERGDGQIEYEVLNAGVSGYSSYQGLMRFREEVSTYTPDLVLVSFGWNDLAQTSGMPDNLYKSPNKASVWFVRTAVNFKTYLVMKYYLSELQSGQVSAETKKIPRVSREDYIANINGFRQTAEQHNIPLVVLTRPHKLPAAEIKLSNNFEGRVPEYNMELLKFAAGHAVPVVDVQRTFESEKSNYFVDECHFDDNGHQLMAELLYRSLNDYGLLPGGH